MVGCVLAGGLGSRLGGDKACAPLAGRPLVAYALDALTPLCSTVAVVAKRSTALPDGVVRWTEPDLPRHPLTGIVAALEHAGEDVLVVAVDLPLLRAADLAPLLDGRAPGEPRWVVDEPLVAVYPYAALDALRAAPPDAPLRLTVRALAPRAVHVDPARLANVNTPEDLDAAEAVLARGPGG